MLDACVCVLAGVCLCGHLVGGGFALEQEVAKVCLMLQRREKVFLQVGMICVRCRFENFGCYFESKGKVKKSLRGSE